MCYYVWICMTMLTMYDFVGLCMTMYDYTWLCMTLYDYVWRVTMYNSVLLLCMTIYYFVWIFMTVYCTKLCYSELLYLTLYDYVCLCKALLDTVCFCMALYDS